MGFGDSHENSKALLQHLVLFLQRSERRLQLLEQLKSGSLEPAVVGHRVLAVLRKRKEHGTDVVGMLRR